jgi:hypothetical protein
MSHENFKAWKWVLESWSPFFVILQHTWVVSTFNFRETPTYISNSSSSGILQNEIEICQESAVEVWNVSISPLVQIIRQRKHSELGKVYANQIGLLIEETDRRRTP